MAVSPANAYKFVRLLCVVNNALTLVIGILNVCNFKVDLTAMN